MQGEPSWGVSPFPRCAERRGGGCIPPPSRGTAETGTAQPNPGHGAGVTWIQPGCQRPATRSGTTTGGGLAAPQAPLPPRHQHLLRDLSRPRGAPAVPARPGASPGAAKGFLEDASRQPGREHRGVPWTAAGQGLLAEPTAGMPRPGWAPLRAREWKWGAPNPAGHGGCLLPGSPGCSGSLKKGPVEPPPQGVPLPRALGSAFSCERVLGQRTQRWSWRLERRRKELSPAQSDCLQHDWIPH
ncbi:nascent polypeptide-associated complex subunit alpha, muscle-specific form-like [Onychostruthus taczanowskii]|uniref:nascent polypeptide-associated complex subunit alpha, muscle-specific form-like n=1 Tax=Onychostruthus taczanowskii TaxID=356909 RepID=UPI001B80E42A|nr:nascent polypeptide-associated complex subunit alpha, muscle-specific form-like [Onychostruthus taczanowskii]